MSFQEIETGNVRKGNFPSRTCFTGQQKVSLRSVSTFQERMFQRMMFNRKLHRCLIAQWNSLIQKYLQMILHQADYITHQLQKLQKNWTSLNSSSGVALQMGTAHSDLQQGTKQDGLIISVQSWLNIDRHEKTPWEGQVPQVQSKYLMVQL